eukprot:gene9160-9326_t
MKFTWAPYSRNVPPGDAHHLSVVADVLLESTKKMLVDRKPDHRHKFLTYPFNLDMRAFSSDMAAVASSSFLYAMRIGYKILAAMTEMVIGNEGVMQEIAALQPHLIIGDSSPSYGHYLTSLLGIPAVEFDVGTSSAMLHAGVFGGQQNPSYIPAPGTFYPSTGMSFPQRCINLATAAAVQTMTYVCTELGPVKQ